MSSVQFCHLLRFRVTESDAIGSNPDRVQGVSRERMGRRALRDREKFCESIVYLTLRESAVNENEPGTYLT